jgi:hypothetical protein
MKKAVVKPMPYAVQAAMVDCASKLFWYWDAYRHLMRASGVSASVATRLTDRQLSKPNAMRELLCRLEAAGPRGRTVEINLINAMASLDVTEQDGVDPVTAHTAQDVLRTAARKAGLLELAESQQAAATELAAAKARRAAAEQRTKDRAVADQRRRKLHVEYCELLTDGSNLQARGYRLEEMLGEVAELDGLGYTRPFRKGSVTQTDGMITFDSFQYLLEVRWQDKPADATALTNLAGKAHRNLTATRALFLSVMGFRKEVVDEIETGTKNLLLMSGQEFSIVLGGELTLAEAMRLKVDEGAKRGRIFFDLASHAAA